MQERLANRKDIERLMEIITNAIKVMKDQGIYQWDEFYPTRKDIEVDIENNELYVVEDNHLIVSLFVLNQEKAPGYVNGRFKYHGDNYIVIHRLCVDPKIQGRGIGTKTVQLAIKKAKEQGYEAVWLDAFSENPRALKMYEHNGFHYAGQVIIREILFYLYEQLI